MYFSKKPEGSVSIAVCFLTCGVGRTSAALPMAAVWAQELIEVWLFGAPFCSAMDVQWLLMSLRILSQRVLYICPAASFGNVLEMSDCFLCAGYVQMTVDGFVKCVFGKYSPVSEEEQRSKLNPGWVHGVVPCLSVGQGSSACFLSWFWNSGQSGSFYRISSLLVFF